MPQKSYFEFIDGIRFVAVILVVVFHIAPAAAPGGYVGVDVFFVISGFLITKIVLSEKFNYFSFLAGRCRRILPAYLFFVIGTAAIVSMTYLPLDVRSFSSTIFAAPLFLQNFVFWKSTDYFSPTMEINPFVHTWSLAVEWQFYVLFPGIVRLFAFHRTKLIAALTLIFLVTLAFSSWGAIYKPLPTFYLMPFRVWEFLTGSYVVLLAVPRQKMAGAIAFAGLSSIIFSAVVYDGSTYFPGATALLPCIGTGLVLAGGLSAPNNFVAKVLSLRTIRTIGQASYSIYLAHWPIVAFGNYFFGSNRSVIVSVGMGSVSIIIGLASWHWIERPFRRPAAEASSPAFRPALIAAGSLILVLLSGAIYIGNGFPGRFDDRVLTIEQAAEDSGHFRSCLANEAPESWDESTCRFGDPGIVPRIVLWGDSHATAIADGLDAWARRNRMSGVFIGTDACPPLTTVEGRFRAAVARCRRIQAAMPRLLRAHHPDLLILHAAWLGYRRGDPVGFDEGVRRDFAVLPSLAQRVLIIGPIPGARANVPLAMARQVAYGIQAPLGLTASSMKNVQAVGEILREAAAANALTYLDLIPSICQPQCATSLDDLPFYFDQGHITSRASRRIIEQNADVLAVFAPAPDK